MHTPCPFCYNSKNIKAFVLGCDPTNFSDNGKPVQLKYVFSIGEDPRYFKDILANLNLIGLHLEDIYVQNMIPNYLEEETSRNKEWKKIAEEYLPQRIKEFNMIDPKQEIPVFLTAEKLYKFLLNDGEKALKAGELYQLKTPIPIVANKNKLGRPLIPFYRHFKYNLKNWEDYLNNFKNIQELNNKAKTNLTI